MLLLLSLVRAGAPSCHGPRQCQRRCRRLRRHQAGRHPPRGSAATQATTVAWTGQSCCSSKPMSLANPAANRKEKCLVSS